MEGVIDLKYLELTLARQKEIKLWVNSQGLISKISEFTQLQTPYQ